MVSTFDRDWMVQAACRDRDLSWWFPWNEHAKAAQRAIAVCAGCPVLSECAHYADGIGAHYGIWAGVYRLEQRGYQQSHLQLKPHGTVAAYRRHARHGEQPCDLCKDANRLAAAARKEQRA